MIIGVPREIRADEYRVAMTPAGAEQLRRAGHSVIVERGAGLGSGFADEDYQAYGALVAATAEEVFGEAELVCKVKEPQAGEIRLLRSGQILFTFLHLAASRELTEGLLRSGCTAVAYETVRDSAGRLPLLAPMSEVAGKMSVQEAARCLGKPTMGRGILLGGIPGVAPANVLVLGGGVVGAAAARVAAGLGANVNVLDVDLNRLRYLDETMPANVHTIFSTPEAIRARLPESDAVIGAVLIPGARAPMLIPREYLTLMQPGAVIVDVGIDQGGCCETIRPTTHREPTFVVDQIVHYGVTNMPGAVGRTSTLGLTHATIGYVLRLAKLGLAGLAAQDAGFAAGVSVFRGELTCPAVAATFDLPLKKVDW
ncbi:MAG: alanine dehydrogenase [Phycisphaerales bacterium]|nr:alanine dehydrogenase [Phycisphaerales bacterium]